MFINLIGSRLSTWPIFFCLITPVSLLLSCTMASPWADTSNLKSIDAIPWCNCKKCFKMTAVADHKCCRKKPGGICITDDEDFKSFVETSWRSIEDDVTQRAPHWTVLDNIKTFSDEERAEVERRRLRLMAYAKMEEFEKQIKDEFHKDWSTTLPSCVTWKVRLHPNFRAPSGLFTGYFSHTGQLTCLRDATQ